MGMVFRKDVFMVNINKNNSIERQDETLDATT